MYDLDKPEVPKDAFGFYLPYVENSRGPILEPMCGSGRFLIPMLDRGFDIDGVDASAHMLEACRTHCTRKGLKPALYHQFLHQMDLPRKYGLVFIPAGSIILIIDQAQVLESLKRIYNHMLSQAKLVLEVETPRARPKNPGQWGGKWVNRPDGGKVVLSWLSTYDEDTQLSRSLTRYDLFSKEGELLQTELEEFNLRFYELSEFRALLESSGFVDVRTYKLYQTCEADEDDETIIFECGKP
jgi:ubiquinone/menaquinone biosynthesis C-methylase UbiE